MKSFRVRLHPDCVAQGGREEYPDGQIGQEMPPAVEKEGDESEADLATRAQAEYETSAKRTEERLRYIKFGQAFVGRNHQGRPARKTDANNGMWVPEWQLVPVPEPALAS